MIYLLHFHARLSGHAQHYLGFTSDLAARLRLHQAGAGARIMAAVRDAGITWEVARTWPGDRTEERRLKGRAIGSRELRELCPVCNPGMRINRWAGGGRIVARRELAKAGKVA